MAEPFWALTPMAAVAKMVAMVLDCIVAVQIVLPV